jgi:hypothetical protein
MAATPKMIGASRLVRAFPAIVFRTYDLTSNEWRRFVRRSE